MTLKHNLKTINEGYIALFRYASENNFKLSSIRMAFFKKEILATIEELQQLKLRIMQKQTQYSRAEVVRIIEGIEGLKELNFESLGENSRKVESGGVM